MLLTINYRKISIAGVRRGTVLFVTVIAYLHMNVGIDGVSVCFGSFTHLSAG